VAPCTPPGRPGEVAHALTQGASRGSGVWSFKVRNFGTWCSRLRAGCARSESGRPRRQPRTTVTSRRPRQVPPAPRKGHAPAPARSPSPPAWWVPAIGMNRARRVGPAPSACFPTSLWARIGAMATEHDQATPSPSSFGLRAAKGEAAVAGNSARAIQRPCPELTWLHDRPERGKEELVLASPNAESTSDSSSAPAGVSPRARAGGIDLSR
jgi:hypothetical protein